MADRVAEIRARLAEHRASINGHCAYCDGLVSDEARVLLYTIHFDPDLEWACGEIERLREECDAMTRIAERQAHVRSEAQREIVAAAFREGAEAMRQAVLAGPHWVSERFIRALPIPEPKR